MESSLRTVFNSLPRTDPMRVRQVERSYPSTSSRRTVLMFIAPVLSFDLRSTLVVAVEISQAAWVIAAHVPGLGHVKTRRRIEPNSEALLDAVEHLKRRASIAPEHVVVTYEAGYSGFWLARLQQRHAIEVYVIQPVSVPPAAQGQDGRDRR
jgi:hypothetical protein